MCDSVGAALAAQLAATGSDDDVSAFSSMTSEQSNKWPEHVACLQTQCMKPNCIAQGSVYTRWQQQPAGIQPVCLASWRLLSQGGGRAQPDLM